MLAHVEFRCRCGRTLRAKLEQAGTTVRCWSCHGEQLVPEFGSSAQLARDHVTIFRGVFQNGTVGPLLLGGAILAGVSAIPWVGVWIALVLAGWAAARYDTLFWGPRETDESIADTSLRRSWLTSASHWLVGVVAVLVWILPFVFRYADRPLTGRRWPLTGAMLAPLALIGWVAVPLVLLMLSAWERGGAGDSSRALAAARRHPLAVANALLLVPLGMILIELCLVLGAWQQGRLPNLVLDLFPTPRSIVPVPGKANPTVDVTSVPDSKLFAFYGEGLSKGYTLTGAIPASLPLGVDTYASAANVNVEPRIYLALRLILSALIYWGAASLFVIQARWLGRICARRPRPQFNTGQAEGRASQNGSQGSPVPLTQFLDRR